ncbi:putative phytochrome-like histidine kinase PHY2p [Halenospora varia]|nr:putative phytochrome-like histidine kinase PHY2p [Halenospora varia]
MSDIEFNQEQERKPVVFLPASAFNVERVFPIRGLVDVPEREPIAGSVAQDTILGHGSKRHKERGRGGGTTQLTTPTATTAALTVSATDPEGRLDELKCIHESIYTPPPYPPIPPKDSIRLLQPTNINTNPLEGKDKGDGFGVIERPISERTQLVPSESGPPGILPGQVAVHPLPTLYRCEDEPIHIPGAIQQFGALVAVRSTEDDQLQVRICSENTQQILGYSPEELFNLKSMLDILDDRSQEELQARISYALGSDALLNEDTHLDVFPVTMRGQADTHHRLWCAVHLAESPNDFVICEFEDYSDVFYLRNPEAALLLPKVPTASAGINVSSEELEKSMTRGSRPLRALEVARRRKQTEFSSMDIFNAMTQAQEQLSNCTAVQQVFDAVVGLIAELTGFHRVMFYRFDEDQNGIVDAELVNPEASSLHYPASDIPKQARELYKKNRIRILFDRDAETARLVCRDAGDFAVPLDLTHSYLRAMSPIHLKYLGNMGVRSSMSVSIVIKSELWGLVACHEYGDVGLRVSLSIRELCRNIGECAAVNIERLLMLQQLEARRPPTTAPPTQSPAGFIAASSADLLRVFDADFGLLSIHDEARAIGRLHPYREALVILRHLQNIQPTTIVSSQSVTKDFPGIKYPPGINSIAGLLIIPLSVGGRDFLVFFRKGQLREVRWAGNPYDKILQANTQYLEPRTSFKRWTETVVGRSKSWTGDQLETATVLSLLYGRFIEMWRQKESASQTSQMTRLLIRNSSHEVRTPLNAIINYLEMALENKLDDSTRELLDKAHTASRSLIYVIDDLLNLTKAEEGPINTIDDTFDLGATVSDVITAFRKEAMRKGLDLTVSTHQGIPEIVKGDASRLRQVLSNLTSNAFQHSIEGGIKVDIRPISRKENMSVIGITVQDVGAGMSESQLDDLFQEFEQVIDNDNGVLSTDNTPSTGDNSRSLGVGLAVVARYVHNANGQLRVCSELGKGTIFGIEIPFDHANQITISRLPESLPEHVHLPRSLSEDITDPKQILPREGRMQDVVEGTKLDLTENRQHDTQHFQNFSSGYPSSLSTNSGSGKSPISDMTTDPSRAQRKLTVLIAEDNPINARLLGKRLLKLGHEVETAYDGQECHDYFCSKPHKVDVILMDLQMPLVDGEQSTKMIRKFERDLHDLLVLRPRVPIFAVSASLLEAKRFEYIQSGFDGWILKPIDFGRLDFLLRCLHDQQLKSQALYAPGHWGKGGWFLA